MEHVLGNMSDGAMFYIVSKGIEGTPMPAWEKTLSEEQRWQVITFLKGSSNMDMATEKMPAVAAAPTPVPGNKGVCGPATLVAIALLPLLAHFARKKN